MSAAKPELDPVFTDNLNEYGPVGNDTGSDVLGDYRKWRAKGSRPGPFLPELLRSWEIGDYDWDDTDIRVILDEMRRSTKARFERLTRDDVIIALAFAQVIVDGVALPKIVERALKAAERQLNPSMIEFRGWQDPEYRREVLGKVITFLSDLGTNS